MDKIRPERVLTLNDKPIQSGCKYIVYRMQSSVRISTNLALWVAMELAKSSGLQLKVIYHLNASFPEANYRHFSFLIDGLIEVGRTLSAKGIPFSLLYGSFEEEIQALYPTMAAMVTDMGYLRYYREQENWLVKNLPCKLIRVEDNLCIPVAATSYKAEWAARTIRPKIVDKLPHFLTDAEIDCTPVYFSNQVVAFDSEDSQLLDFCAKVKGLSPLPTTTFIGGEKAAEERANQFVEQKLLNYSRDRSHPEEAATSRISPYLHFGMISSLSLVHRLATNALAASFIEELVVRRELAHNFVWYNNAYDSYSSLPEWSRRTLALHATDKRPFVYTLDQLESMQTHDECWNAAMQEMVTSGFMENTMRMYWGKKILEWTNSPEEAFEFIAYLNNKYELDGRDANSWAGIGWCLGLHDTAWKERPVFGTVRYMNEAGLYRKYDMKRYIHAICASR